MNIEKATENDIHIYVFKGRIDFHPHDLLEKSILKDAITNHAKGVILDLTELSYISSLGIRYLFEIKNELVNKNINFAITGASQNIIQVFRLLGLYNAFSIFPTVEDAKNFFNTR